VDDAEVVVDGEVGKDPPVVGDVADAAADQLKRLPTRHILPFEEDGPPDRPEQAPDALHRRRLPRAVAAEQADDLPLDHWEKIRIALPAKS
jgi:hypothetical protein